MNARARIELGDGYGSDAVRPDGLPLLNAGWGAEARETETKARNLIREVRKAREAERAAARLVESHVQELRTMGASWAVIAAAVGTTKAAAHKRYANR